MIQEIKAELKKQLDNHKLFIERTKQDIDKLKFMLELVEEREDKK